MPRGRLCCLKSQALSYSKIPPLQWKPRCDPRAGSERAQSWSAQTPERRLTADWEVLSLGGDLQPAIKHTRLDLLVRDFETRSLQSRGVWLALTLRCRRTR